MFTRTDEPYAEQAEFGIGDLLSSLAFSLICGALVYAALLFAAG